MHKALVITAHPDDVALGCGGTLFRLERERWSIRCVSFTKGTDLARNKTVLEDQENARQYLNLYNIPFIIHDFRNRFLYESAANIRYILEQERDIFQPSLVFTHWKGDIHQDHKTIHEESIRVFRNQSILECQGICSTPNFFSNYYYALSEYNLKQKIYLLSLFKSQQGLYYTQKEGIQALTRAKGMEIGQTYAEGFYCRRMIL